MPIEIRGGCAFAELAGRAVSAKTVNTMHARIIVSLPFNGTQLAVVSNYRRVIYQEGRYSQDQCPRTRDGDRPVGKSPDV
jgi:hypothetical protein